MLSDPYFDELRRREFARLDERHHAYLDYTGSALYGESQIRAHHAVLSTGLFGNPHAEHGPSRASTEVMEAARNTVLQFLGVDSTTHDVCFTANTTAAIKLIAESYPFGPESTFLLSVDNHNSVNGIREYARRAGARIRYLPLDAELHLDGADAVFAERSSGLFAYPAQSNFSGMQHPLSLVERAREAGFHVLLDLAAFAPSHAISLRDCAADFAVLSFYKLFGYPTGIGALVGRREALARLRRPWFAGDRRGELISYSAVEERARAAGVSLRGGCFCNPGASEVAFGLGATRLAECLDTIGDAFAVERLASCIGAAVGAVRVSVGLANNSEDVRRAIAVVRSFAEH